MQTSPLLPLIFLLAQAVGIAALELGLFSLRSQLGLVPLSVTIGVLQLFQNLLATTVYVQLAPGMLIGPGSVVVFTANLSMILLVYIREDALEARKLAYGITGANILAGALMYLTGLSLEQSWVVNLTGVPAAVFRQSLRVSIASTAALALDVIGIILLYEAVSRRIRGSFFLRIWLTINTVLAADTVVFCTAAFAGQPTYGTILASNIVGKQVSGLLFAGVLRLYLQYTGRKDSQSPRGALKDIFHLLTFRQKYEAMTELVHRDSLTGVYSRRFFDEILPRELSLARRSGRPVGLIMIDLDHFKRINDSWGHQIGDAALRTFACFLLEAVRSSDVVCRLGGEEFVVVLGDTTAAGAVALAEKLADRLREAQRQPAWALPVTFTITCGVAGFPEDGGDADLLVHAADSRLYRGKEQGRDRVVGPSG